MRVVSLNCSNTEITCALGMGRCLVGVDSDSDHPAHEIAHLPRVGRDLEIDIEAVVSLRPDLVLASLTVPGHERIVEGLRKAGLRYHATRPRSLAEVYGDIETIAGLLGVPERGRRLAAAMRRRIEGRRVPEAARRPSVLVQWWPKPVIAAGRKSWVHDLIELAGGRNALDEDVESRPLTNKEVAALDPDLVVLSWCGVKPEKVRAEVVLENEAFAACRFVRRRAAVEIPEAFLGRPGPRLTEGFEALVRALAGAAGGPAGEGRVPDGPGQRKSGE